MLVAFLVELTSNLFSEFCYSSSINIQNNGAYLYTRAMYYEILFLASCTNYPCMIYLASNEYGKENHVLVFIKTAARNICKFLIIEI